MNQREQSEAWDDVRKAFASSIMVDTSLSSLAQNLDGADWPMKGKDETPANYIDLTYEELFELLALKGQPPGRVEHLITILTDTLAFDNPFGEMVEQNEAAAAKDNQLLKNMAKLGIPEDFPIGLTSLTQDTKEFCRLENLTTLGAFSVFAQSMAQNVIVGGDFRKLLNALSHVDEATLAEVLPYRPGAKGLHLVEALAADSKSADPKAGAAKSVGYFQEDVRRIKADLAGGGPLARHFAVLNNRPLEAAAAELLRPYLVVAAVAPAKRPAAPKKPGFLQSVLSVFRR